MPLPPDDRMVTLQQEPDLPIRQPLHHPDRDLHPILKCQHSSHSNHPPLLRRYDTAQGYLLEEKAEVDSRLKVVSSELNRLGKRRSEILAFLSDTDIVQKYKESRISTVAPSSPGRSVGGILKLSRSVGDGGARERRLLAQRLQSRACGQFAWLHGGQLRSDVVTVRCTHRRDRQLVLLQLRSRTEGRAPALRVTTPAFVGSLARFR